MGPSDIPTEKLRDREAVISTAPFLRVFTASGSSTYLLPASGEVVIGRAATCDLVIEDTSISRKHATLRIGPTLTLEDHGSSNGVTVGARTLGAGEQIEVRAGDLIELGTVLIALQGTGGVLSGSAKSSAGPAKRPAVVADPAMERVWRLVERIAASELPVLVLGETGAGKEVVAEALHGGSARAKGPLVKLNCAAFSESLLESELFGHEKGAFTGADRAKPGLLETAAKGTVLLDEIGEMPASLQAKLLRVLEQHEVMRVGALAPTPIDVRFVAATHRDLAAEVSRGRFRQDLYFRLNGISLVVPPLRDRPSEVEPLARQFAGRTPLTPAALAKLKAHRWPGNVRELRNAIARAVVLSAGKPIDGEHLVFDESPSSAAQPMAADLPTAIEAMERKRILEALEQCGGNQSRTAKLLGISRNTLIARLDGYGIARPRKK